MVVHTEHGVDVLDTPQTEIKSREPALVRKTRLGDCMNRLPWFPECLSLPETGTMVGSPYFGFNFLISQCYSFVWIWKIATTRTLIVALRYRKRKKNGRGSPSALTLGFALQRIERKPGGSRSGCIEPQPSSLFIWQAMWMCRRS